MNKGRLQFRHLESVFETREKAYKYIEDIVNEHSGEGHKLDESLMAEPIVVAYKDANQKPQAIVCIGVKGKKGDGTLEPYHIIDSAKLEEEIQSMSSSTVDIRQALEKEIERATKAEIALQSELDATQTGAGLDTGGKYISHSDGNYISGATSIDNATVLLDSALKTESDRATKAEGSISGAVNTLSANTVSEVKRIEDKISDNEKVISESINQLKAEIDRTEVGAGLNDDGSYKGHDSQLEGIVYITTANSLDEADVLLDKGIQTETGRATNAEEKLRNSITESATKLSGLSAATENAISTVQSELNDTQTGAGLNDDGTYHKHNTEGDMGNYISNATSIDNATILLDSALKNEEARATAAENTISGAVNTLSTSTKAFSGATVTKFTEIDEKIQAETDRATKAEGSISGAVTDSATKLSEFSAATKTAIAGIENKLSDNEKVISEAINQLKYEIDRTEVGAGLNDDGSYKGHDSQLEGIVYIATANSLDEADVLLDKGIQTETTARKEADTAITTKITTEETRAKDAENAISTKVTAIEEKIPNQANKDNQLADKEFVNSSISTATATFRGTFETLVELNAVTEVDNNDYAFYKHKDDAGNTLFDKYCYDGMDWKYQYTLNNSSFTAAQWAAINSEVTKTSIEELTNKVNNINVEPFIITITSDATGYHVDKTANEILNVCKQNKTIILTSDDFNTSILLVTNIYYDNNNFSLTAYDTSFSDGFNFEWTVYCSNIDTNSNILVSLEKSPYVLPRDIQPFVITLTKVGDTYTKDKTYGDINDAITNKKDIYILSTDNVLYRVNDMLSTIDESNSGAISLNFEEINPFSDTIIYQLAIVVVNGSETMSLNSRTQNIPTIDTSIPTSPNDNCVPSTKLLVDNFVQKTTIANYESRIAALETALAGVQSQLKSI